MGALRKDQFNEKRGLSLRFLQATTYLIGNWYLAIGIWHDTMDSLAA